MLNRPTNIFDEASSGESAWHVDRNPGVRLVWLFVVMLLPLSLVGVRLVCLQVFLADSFAVEFEQTTESFEPIPSPDGRILASDGSVLAHDIVRFNVRMHYRWLEEPADRDWLRKQALDRLPRSRRRDADRILAEEQKVLALRREMWNQLARTAGIGPEEFSQTRHRNQDRVERIVASVRRRRREQQQVLRQAESSARADDNQPWWRRAWQLASASLTTAPWRQLRDPVIVTEQFDYHTVVENISRPVAIEIESHPGRFPGLRVEMTTERAYPWKSLASHVTGERTRIMDEELERRNRRFPDGDPLDYRAGDRIGKTGVERTYDRHLHGLGGLRKVVRDRRGEVIHTEVDREPRIGRDVILTLNLKLQERAEQLLDDALAGTGDAEDETGGSVPSGGSIVALDVHTGAVFAAASAPRYDLDLLVNPDPDRLQQVHADPRHPFHSRITHMMLPPGSVFKTLSAVALLESRITDPDEPIDCQGFLDTPDRHRCWRGHAHGEVNLSNALCRSCNVYFFTAARRMGANPIIDWAERFGFGRPTGIDLPGECGGNLPAPRRPAGVVRQVSATETDGVSEIRSSRTEPYMGDALGLAIGQSTLTVTPLQVARMMAAVANGGYLVTPHVARGTGPALVDDEESDTIGLYEPRRIPGLSQSTLERVREGLRKVVENPRGTGYKRVRLEQITVAGKTGTAEVGGGKEDHAWFAGYVPADKPRIAFAVVLEHGGSGGKDAGPIARSLIEAMLELEILQPTQLSMHE